MKQHPGTLVSPGVPVFRTNPPLAGFEAPQSLMSEGARGLARVRAGAPRHRFVALGVVSASE